MTDDDNDKYEWEDKHEDVVKNTISNDEIDE